MTTGRSLDNLGDGSLKNIADTLSSRSDLSTGYSLVSLNSFIAQDYLSTVLADNPVFYWDMSDASGSTVYNKSSGGSGFDAVVTPASIGVRSGFPEGWAYYTAYSAAAVYISDSSITSRTTSEQALELSGDMTFETWIAYSSLPSPSNWKMFCSMGGNLGTEACNAQYWLALYNNAGTYQIYCLHQYGVNISEFVTINWTPTILQDYHVVIVRNATAKTYEAFIDGASIGSAAYTTAPTGGTDVDVRPRMYSNIGETTFLDAYIGSTAIYNTALSSTRILAHYNAGI